MCELFFSDAPPTEREKESIIINLSSKPVSPTPLTVLNYGLGFVPTPPYNPFHTRVDLLVV